MRRGRIGLALVGSLLALALGAASGCGGDDAEAGVPTAKGGSATPRPGDSSGPGSDDTRVFAQCIRDHGVPNFPDPGPDGGFSDTNIKGLDRSALLKAMDACQDVAPAGLGDATGKMSPDQAEKWTKFAGCMRDSGIALPDPDPNRSLLDWVQGWAKTIDSGDTKVRKAAEACQQKSGIDIGGIGQ